MPLPWAKISPIKMTKVPISPVGNEKNNVNNNNIKANQISSEKKIILVQTWDENKFLWLLICSDNVIDTKYCDCYFKNSESTGFHHS